MRRRLMAVALVASGLGLLSTLSLGVALVPAFGLSALAAQIIRT